MYPQRGCARRAPPLDRQRALGRRQGTVQARIDAGRLIERTREAFENRLRDVVRLFAVFELNVQIADR